jgi:hypothetical protein
MSTKQPASGPSMQAYDVPRIPQEDRDHAWELARKYPPDIVLFIIRDALEQHSNTVPKIVREMAPPTLRSMSPTLESATPRTQPVNRRLAPIGLSVATSQGEISGTAPPSSSGNGLYHVDSKSMCNGITDIGTSHWSNVEIFDVDDPSLSTAVSPDRGGCVARTTKNSIRKSRQSSDKQSDGGGDQRKPYFCVFEEHKVVRFGKVSDLRKHMNLYHEPGKKAWLCPEDGCRQFFSRAESFKQHHRTHKGCRKPCKHADNGKIKIPPRQAFACGCQSCQALFVIWEEWREHVIQHIENGMSESQWQYATIVLNLLRRPEIATQWEAQLSRAHSFNLVPRFNFRPRKTLTLKWHLEHMSPTELQTAALTLALQAYEVGIEIRTLNELSDPFSLVKEPQASPSSAMSQFTPWQALPEEFSLPPSSTDYEGTFPLPAQQLPPDLQPLALQIPLLPTWNCQRSNSHTLEFMNPNGLFDPFGMVIPGSDRSSRSLA